MGQVVLHGNQRNENSRWRNFPVWLEITALIVLLTGIETSYIGAYIWECHSTWQFKPYVPTFSARLCSQNQAMSAQISQKFKNKVLSLKSVQPKKKTKAFDHLQMTWTQDTMSTIWRMTTEHVLLSNSWWPDSGRDRAFNLVFHCLFTIFWAKFFNDAKFQSWKPFILVVARGIELTI